MANNEIHKIVGRVVDVPGNDIDTDRITPARYLKVVTFDDLGDCLFYDERFDEGGNPKKHPLNDPRFDGATLMLVGRNFGCGSSREHSPQALMRGGYRVFIGESFAEIFFSNCTTLGLVCLTAPHATIRALAEAAEADPSLEATIDLETKTIRMKDTEYGFELPESVRQAFVSGQWDPLDQLLETADAVAAVYDALPYAKWNT